MRWHQPQHKERRKKLRFLWKAKVFENTYKWLWFYWVWEDYDKSSRTWKIIGWADRPVCAD